MWSTRRPTHPAVRAFLAAATVTALAATTGTQPAAAAPPGDTTAATYLTAHPGGTIISNTEISYQGGAFVVTLTRDTRALATADCPAGWFCFYDGVNFGYPRGRLSSCGWQDLAWWGWHDRTESVHYNLNTGTVWFINHVGSGHSGDFNVFDAGIGRRTRSDVSPYRNIADHVNRIC